MSFQPEKIPTTREELSFKVVESYEKLLDQCEKGLITAAQLDTAIKTLIAATGWAIDKDVFRLLSDAEIEEDDSFAIKRVFTPAEIKEHAVLKSFPQRGAIELWMNGHLAKTFDCFNSTHQTTLIETLSLGLFKKYNLRRVK